MWWRGKTVKGYCIICDTKTKFLIKGKWLRDNFVCQKCNSIPRQRALIYILKMLYPNYKELQIHESSPGGPASEKLLAECPDFTFSFYFPDVPPGEYKDNMRCENLEELTFPDNSFDIFITQDVLEHVLHPDKAFKEIARVLKPNGAHIFTVPLYHTQKTTFRVLPTNEGLKYLTEKVFHSNPIDPKGSLVITDWGYDLPHYIFEHSGMYTTIFNIRNRELGLDGEFLDVLVSRKIKCFERKEK